jgi:hypothetical protein
MIRDEVMKASGGPRRPWLSTTPAAPVTELPTAVTTSLYHVGFSLQGAISMPADVARERIAEALQRLDDTIREIRDQAFTTRAGGQAQPWPWPWPLRPRGRACRSVAAGFRDGDTSCYAHE